MYDIIGDVHGYASLLKKLLLKMGYVKTNGSYSHPTRKAVFVGDFINRGPEIRKTVKIIRGMVENENAYAILGNHELNAIIYHLKDKEGFLFAKEPHKYFLSLFKTIHEYSPYSSEWDEQLRWMRSLPLYLDFGKVRIVHACWSDKAIKVVDSIREDGKIRKRTFKKIQKKSDPELSRSIWLLTKGVNLKMPHDLKIINNKGVSPRSIGIKWWEKTKNKTFKQLSFESKYELPSYTIPNELLPMTYPYPENAPIVFFGHFCQRMGPRIIKSNICCVDSCIHRSKILTAYRWSGEKELIEKNLIQLRG
ncbi:MAG: metallophosphoesterase [Bacteroidota bacterium]